MPTRTNLFKTQMNNKATTADEKNDDRWNLRRESGGMNIDVEIPHVYRMMISVL